MNRPYGVYPYSDYRTSSSLIFSVQYESRNIHPKTRVLGVTAAGRTMVYPIDLFENNETTIIQDTIAGQPVVVAGNKDKNFIVAYANELDGKDLNFSPTLDNTNGSIMEDQFGNVWNIFGEAISGPDQLKRLPEVTSYIGFWFSWSAFHPSLEVYEAK